MRRLFISIFTVYYLVVSAGVTVHSHYCMGKLASMDLFHSRKNPCPCGEKGEMPGCCNHEVVVLKTDVAGQTAIESLPVPPIGMLDVPIPVASNIFQEWASDIVILPVFESIRSCRTIPFYLLFGVFRN